MLALRADDDDDQLPISTTAELQTAIDGMVDNTLRIFILVDFDETEGKLSVTAGFPRGTRPELTTGNKSHSLGQ